MDHQKKYRARAMKIAATAFGVASIAMSGAAKDELVVTGEGIDTVELVRLLRKKIGSADLLSVGPLADEETKEEKANEANGIPLVWGSQPYYNYNSYLVIYVHDHYDSPSCSLM
ncbi:hypothetical protein POM88_028727 [Heracleum sosnowskyi]|uniref:Uncharacterized protein n=1 Tax=Heracleum sosnowskyi TaxID=360622 RepID=A0AAD8HSC1_9APIA|nr:hypothetical protein POM88_028727 [Heracleum sosnowskyi]